MAIPTYDQFIYPLLTVLGEHEAGLRTRKVYEAVADQKGLAAEERQQLLPSGQQPVFQNRIGWAHDRLKRKGLSGCPSRGLWCLTDAGRAFLTENPDSVDEDKLKWLTTVPMGSSAAGEDPSDALAASASVPGEVQSPEERIDSAVQELQESLSHELLDLIAHASSDFFERLVLDVLAAIGYGTGTGNIRHVGGTGDGGIDGVISLDRLGLEKVYVQAKRWKEKPVGRPDIQAFFGAIAGRRANKGVFITASHFSSDARQFAEEVGVVLVDGRTLASLMIEHCVGVTTHRTVKIARVDSDYFEE